MIRIEITPDHIGYCDPEDWSRLNNHTWFVKRSGQNFYLATTTGMGRRSIFMHRLLVEVPRGMVVDHIDGNGLNNCRSNLRLCTQSQNLGNQRKRGVTSQFKGVCRYPSRSNPWQAKITRDSKLCHLGVFPTEFDAARAYDRAARAYHGAFARLNFPNEGERGIAS